MAAPLVSIIGPPAAGKTTTAEWLAKVMPGRLIREDYDGNPFLASFYLGSRELALASQLYFLFSRVGQLELADWPDAGAAVSDYGFCHDRIYAEQTLTEADLAIYRRLSAQAAGGAHKGGSLSEINNKLNNPGSDLAQLNFKFTWNEFEGNLSLSWGSSGTNTDFSNIYETRVDEQAVRAWFDIPIWDWGQKKNTILASELSLESRELNLEEERYRITMDIRESCRRLDNLVLEIELARRSIESAEKTYEINLEKYQNGDLTSKDLGQYRQSLSNARLNEIRSLINYRLQLLDLKIKSLWDFENDQPVVTLSTVVEEEE